MYPVAGPGHLQVPFQLLGHQIKVYEIILVNIKYEVLSALYTHFPFDTGSSGSDASFGSIVVITRDERGKFGNYSHNSALIDT
jgi:hypothetical protein